MNQFASAARAFGLSTRLQVYLFVVFAMTWPAWWIEAATSHPGLNAGPDNAPHLGGSYALMLYCIAGIGPTIAPFIAVAMTQRDGSLGEYMGRLFRWRVNPIYYLVALGLPIALAWVIEHLQILAGPANLQPAPIKAMSSLITLFPLMVLGGGLEELGWRGLLQPELERRFTRFQAAAIVGIIWALWHLPLFFIPGVAQYGDNFGLFALSIFGDAMMLAMLYGRTRSILLCILFHASGNVSGPIGFHLLQDSDLPMALQLVGSLATLLIGVGLLMIAGDRPKAA